MKTYLDCIPCFLNQALKAMDLNTIDDEKKKVIFKVILKELSDYNLDGNLPKFAKLVYDLIRKEAGLDDPYDIVKKRDNEHSLSILPYVNSLIDGFEDRLLATLKTAIAGNIMDFAAHPDYDVKKKIDEVIHKEFVINDYIPFKQALGDASYIVYLVDNAGEIIFDKLLIELINKRNKKMIIYVKKNPIINDAMMKDVKIASIHDIDNVEIREIDGFPDNGVKDSNGDDILGVIKEADLVISKGQANYECLSEVDANIYFMLIAKCPVIARDLGVDAGSLILKSKL